MSRASKPIAAVRRLAGGLIGLGLLAFAVSSNCGDSAAPPPPVVVTDFSGRYDAASRSLLILPPSDAEPLRFVVAGVATDSAQGVITATVRIRNDAASRRVGPQGCAIFTLTPASITAGTGWRCDPLDIAAPELPAGACLRSHLGTYGADGMLDPGETSTGVAWEFRGWNGGDFTFQVRAIDAGLATSGEIAGTVYLDANHNGGRDVDEPGASGVDVSLQVADSLVHRLTDGAGHYSFLVTEVGNYLLSKPATCCVTGAATYVVPIRLRFNGPLSGFGSGDFGCSRTGPQVLHVAFVDVRRAGDLAPCVEAEACTIPAGTPFAVRFTGGSGCSGVGGIQWQSQRPRDLEPEPFQPYGSEDGFLPFGRDTLAISNSGDTLWSMQRDTVTVRYANRGPEALAAGSLVLRARVRDAEGHVSPLAAGTRRITIDFDPETQLQRRAPCDCSFPPPGCAAGDSVPVGWIAGVDSTEFPPDAWIPFCPGDTLPARSLVRFFARGHDDARDLPIHPVGGLGDVGFSYRFTTRSADFVNLNMPFSSTYPAADFQLPGSGSWHGGNIGWHACPHDYTLFATAVDEHGRLDGTPDSLAFFVDGSPSLDSVTAPLVLVLAPSCSGPLADFCPDLDSIAAFGPDTVLVVGQNRADPTTPLGLGVNIFALPIVAYGHDHPRDRNAAGRTWYTRGHEGSVQAWRFTFDCLGPGCADLAIPGEGGWFADEARVTDPPGQQVFDDSLRFRVRLDTLCTTVPCQAAGIRAVLDVTLRGSHLVTIQGRDFMYETCFEPADLGPNQTLFERSPRGRETNVLGRRVTLVHLEDVRPIATAGAAGWRAALRRRAGR